MNLVYDHVLVSCTMSLRDVNWWIH